MNSKDFIFFLLCYVFYVIKMELIIKFVSRFVFKLCKNLAFVNKVIHLFANVDNIYGDI